MQNMFCEERESMFMTRNFDLASIDKLGVNFTMRIPAITKTMIEELDPEKKKGLRLAILITMAKVLHDAKAVIKSIIRWWFQI